MPVNLQCPGPILKVKEKIDNMSIGQKMEIEASDFGFGVDLQAWCQNTGNTLLSNKIENGKVLATIVKGKSSISESEMKNLPSLGQEEVLKGHKRWCNDGCFQW